MGRFSTHISPDEGSMELKACAIPHISPPTMGAAEAGRISKVVAPDESLSLPSNMRWNPSQRLHRMPDAQPEMNNS